MPVGEQPDLRVDAAGVQYTLTPLGYSLADAVDTLRAWAYTHMDEIALARTSFDDRPLTPGPPTPVSPAPG